MPWNELTKHQNLRILIQLNTYFVTAGDLSPVQRELDLEKDGDALIDLFLDALLVE